MKIEEKMNMAYAGAGIAAGLASKYMLAWMGAALASAIYVGSFVLLKRIVRTKKNSWLISNSAGSFFLMWIAIWILLYNL